MKQYTDDAVLLLQRLIATPSVSREEAAAADIMENAMRSYGLSCHREANNVWAVAATTLRGRLCCSMPISTPCAQ